MKMFSKKFSILTMVTLIAIAMLMSISSVFAEGGSGENIGKITIKWHHYDTGKGFYNPADEGNDVSFWYIFGFKGKDKDGKMQSGLFAQRMYNGKIGETKVDEIDLSNVKDQKGDTYTDCEFEGIYLPLYRGGNTGNAKYGALLDEKAKEITMQFEENMETHTRMSVAKNSIILEKDKNNMPVRFDVESKKTNGTSEYPYKNIKTGYEIYRIINFSEGEIDLSLDNPRNGYSFNGAISRGELGMFNPYNTNKNEYKLHANFTGENKADLDERYSLAITGNDTKGWNLELSSKIKEGNKTEESNVTDFETIYEDDPTMPIGKTKVKQEGVKGKTVKKTAYYYVINENGEEKELESKESVSEIIKPVNKIVLRGTKTSTTDKEAKIITFDANGGKWKDNTSIKTVEANKGEEIKILDAPSREGYVFDYWKGSKYNPGDNYKIIDNHTFVAQWNKIPELEVKDATITQGDDFNLESLVVKATDEEDGDLTKDVKIIDDGGFDKDKVGEYTITFEVKDSEGATVKATAKVTVKDKVVKPDPQKPAKPSDNPKKPVQNTNLPKTGDGSNLFLYGMILGISGLTLAITGYFRKKHAK